MVEQPGFQAEPPHNVCFPPILQLGDNDSRENANVIQRKYVHRADLVFPGIRLPEDLMLRHQIPMAHHGALGQARSAAREEEARSDFNLSLLIVEADPTFLSLLMQPLPAARARWHHLSLEVVKNEQTPINVHSRRGHCSTHGA